MPENKGKILLYHTDDDKVTVDVSMKPFGSRKRLSPSFSTQQLPISISTLKHF